MTKNEKNTGGLEKYLTYDEAFAQMEYEMQRILSSPPKLIKQFTEYLCRSKGKYIRAKALFACAIDTEGLIHPNAVKFAAAIEVLHLATLVHDDVIDDADIRRGMPTLQKKFGKKTAVIAGDYLLCAALSEIGSAENIKDYLDIEFQDYVKKICIGELNQHLNNYNLNLSVRKYLKIIAGKTAALFEASFYAGIILCEEDKVTASKYRRLGRYIGMIFQLLDDCADFEEEKAKEKKPVQSDYEQGVITLPLIYALREDAPFKERTEKDLVDRAEINQTVNKAGGLSFTKLIAKKYYDKSRRIIEDLHLFGEKKERIQGILDLSYRAIKA